MNPTPAHCDIFCKVIDNFGDAAVCWRLARQLNDDHGFRVRLLIDQPDIVHALAPDCTNGRIQIETWRDDHSVHWIAETRLVIEAFACELPESYLAAMAGVQSPPVWINLEYLSAEAWIEDCHALPSQHPRLPLGKYFFFPGFTPRSGGLLCEAAYELRRQAFDATLFRKEFGLPPADQNTQTISLFSYPTQKLAAMIEIWSESKTPVQLLCPGSSQLARQQGALQIRPLPFLPQTRYDELLWLCDINFVRGEDSFVRAQWAQKPFVWHIYAQAENAHAAKLDAFMEAYPAPLAMREFWQSWNGFASAEQLAPTWAGFVAQLPALKTAASNWAAHLRTQIDLASQLVKFYRDRIE